ncbi:hypothetical protein DITRI_Ditri02bG0133400 [Diplodiscus trichospermus]
MEFYFGLVNSKKRLLWVLRPDFMLGKGSEGEGISKELVEGLKKRGYIVGWAPQEEVLAHKAISGSLTHTRWNSTLERLDIKDVCDEKVVEKMVNDLMVDERDGLLKSAAKFAKLAKEYVSVGGPSHSNLDRLIKDIRLMKRIALSEKSSI